MDLSVIDEMALDHPNLLQMEQLYRYQLPVTKMDLRSKEKLLDYSRLRYSFHIYTILTFARYRFLNLEPFSALMMEQSLTI